MDSDYLLNNNKVLFKVDIN